MAVNSLLGIVLYMYYSYHIYKQEYRLLPRKRDGGRHCVPPELLVQSACIQR